MDCVENRHQLKNPQHLNYLLHHHHHIQQQANLHDYFHRLSVAGGYLDSGGSFITSDANAVSCDIFPHIEMEKRSLPQNLYANQCTDISVQMSFKPYEDSHVSVNTHEESGFPSKPCEDVHSIPGKRQNQPFLNDGRHWQRQLPPATRALDLVQPQVRLLCSTGGKIMGRPVDGKLRYCGGDTRLINVEHGICFSDFVTKLSQMYGPGLILKYNLPGEDLDALVSVSSDDDLQNMLDEYDRMVANGNHSWLRLFVCHNQSDLEAASCFDCGNGRAECYSQIMQRYIDIINGFDARETAGQPLYWMVEDCSNGCLSTARVSSDTPHVALLDPSSTVKTFLVSPSASPSVPSSPSGASRQVHYEQCGTDDTCFSLSKEQQNSMLLMNGLGRNTQELAQDHNVDVLKCDHYQSHIQGESPKMRQEPSHHRCDAPSLKANGMRLDDTDVLHVYQDECHRGRGTGYVDTWHGLPRARGLIESKYGPQCGYHLVSQPLNSVACHTGVVDNAFCRCEPAAQFYGEGRKQFLYPNLLHQTGPLAIHGEGPVRSQKGSVYQIADGQQLPHFIKEPLQIPLQNANITGPISVKTMGSTPSSPRHVFGSCCCHHQHFQVDRGINVSLEEDSCSQKQPYLHGLTIRKHGVPFYCSFSDGPNFCSDSGELYCVPTLEKSLEPDKAELDAFSRMHTFPKNNTFCHRDQRSAKEKVASSLMEPIHSFREGSPSQYEICCADFHNAKGLQMDNIRVFPTPEGNAYMGQPDPCSGNHKETMLSGVLPHNFKSEASLERAGDTVMALSINYGDGNSNVQNGLGASGYTQVLGTKCSPADGHKGLQYGLKSQSFCSTDATVGSFSSLSLEPGVWVNSSSTAIPNDYSKKREGPECSHLVDFSTYSRHGLDGSVKHEVSGDISRFLSFDRMDCHTSVRSSKSSADSVESSIEISPVLSFATMAEDKSSTLTENMMNVSYLYGSEHNFDDNSCPLMSSQPFLSRALEPDAFGESPTLPVSLYDQSPRSSGGNAPLFFSGSDSKCVSLEKKAREPCANNSIAFMTSYHQNHGQYQEMDEIDVESTPQRIYEYEGKPMSEESRTNSKPSSRHCSVGTELNQKDSEIVLDAQSQETDQMLQQVSVSGSVDACPEYDEKGLPPSQAEAEAIARGLQIIKNDDLEDLKELGSGTYGTVFHGRWKGSDVAIKRIKPSFFMGSPSEQERLISDFWREAGTLSQLHHPNIVAFYGVVPDGPERSLANVTEYMVNGSLKQVLMKKDRTIDRRKRLLIAMDAAFGMEYLHSKRIIHFDLKSENLLVNMRDVHRPICKVGDFGLSKVKQQTLVSGGVRGTLPWMAPELLSTKGRVTEKVDVYSFGIVMWELLTGEQPYANMHCGTIIGGVVNEDLRPVIPSWCDTSWRHLMERCWSGNPVDRPDFSTVASELRGIASSMNVK